MQVLDYLKDRRKEGTLHLTLIDPDKQRPDEAARLAKMAKDAGTDAIMVGGSQAAQLVYLDETVKKIKEATGLPVILFPSSHSAISKDADAIFFMSLLNTRSTQYLIDEQVRGSVLVHQYGIEPLGMAYLIVESGNMTSVAMAGDAKPIPREKPEFAVAYSLAGKYFGMKLVYLEAGSGAKMSVPEEMVGAVKKAVGEDMLVIVGGGIRDPEAAKKKVAAGADIIVTGNIGEDNPDALKQIIQAIKAK
jgi:phosphoglycerol geranylgeranyltransferase